LKYCNETKGGDSEILEFSSFATNKYFDIIPLMRENFFDRGSKVKKIIKGVTFGASMLGSLLVPRESTGQNQNTNFADTPEGRALVNKYAYTLPANEEYQKSPDLYWDKVLFEIREKNPDLSGEDLDDILKEIQNPLIRPENSTVRAKHTEDASGPENIKELDLNSPEANPDLVNLKYKYNQNLEQKRPSNRTGIVDDDVY